MPDPVENSELQAFVRIVETKSISRAAAELGVPRATVSRRLARLEERLQVRLVRRSTRSLHITDAGEALHRHAQVVLEAVSRAEASVQRREDEIAGVLRVSVPPRMPPSFHTLLVEFTQRYPRVQLEVHASTRLVDLLRDGFDVALRASRTLAPGLIARKLASQPLVAVASPAYLEEMGEPKTVRDLARHRCLLGFGAGDTPENHWPAGRGRQVHVKGSFACNDLYTLAAMALGGRGIALLPMFFVQAQLDAGELVRVLPRQIDAKSQIAVVYAERELMPPQLRAFIDVAVRWNPEMVPESGTCGEGAKGPFGTSRAT